MFLEILVVTYEWLLYTSFIKINLIFNYMLSKWLVKLLFGSDKNGNESMTEPISTYSLYSLIDGDLTLDLNEHILSQIISIPEPFDDSQKKALQDRISTYEIAQSDNIANQKNLEREYKIMQLPEVISKVLSILDESGEDRKKRMFHDDSIFKIDYIQKAIQKRNELKSIDQIDRNHDLFEEIEKDFMNEDLDDEYEFSEYRHLFDRSFFRRSLSALDIICSIENPTVEGVVQTILGTESAYENKLHEIRKGINLRYNPVKDVMKKSQVNGPVSKALSKSKKDELNDFKERNKPFITSNNLRDVRYDLLYQDKRHKQYDAEEEILRAEAVSIDSVGNSRLKLMDLKDGDVSYTLEKIYSQEQGTTNFDGKVIFDCDLDEKMSYKKYRKIMVDVDYDFEKNVEEYVVGVLSKALTEEGLHVVNKKKSLVIDEVATLSIGLNHYSSSGMYLDKINYESNLGELDVNSLKDELMRVQKVFKIVGMDIPDITDAYKHR